MREYACDVRVHLHELSRPNKHSNKKVKPVNPPMAGDRASHLKVGVLREGLFIYDETVAASSRAAARKKKPQNNTGQRDGDKDERR